MILTLDFETKAITDTERYPAPVGAAVKIDGRRSEYLAWDHAGGQNNCSKSEARNKLYTMVRDAERVLMFNAGYDVRVAKHLGIGIPWSKVDDAQILAFLAEPYADKLDLKSVALRALGVAPDEQADLHAWIKANVREAKGKKKLTAFTSFAPGDLAGRYACGDVDRTHGLFRYWKKLTQSRAYARECQLLGLLDEMYDEGVPLDEAGIAQNLPVWQAALARADSYLRRLLKADVDLDRPSEVVAACEKAGLVKEWILTEHPTDPKPSLAYEALHILDGEGKFDHRFVEALGYRSVLRFTLSTFAEPWSQVGKVLHPQWNGTRQERGGARTGRLSSTPNVQNIVKVPPTFDVPRSWPPLPRMRHFVLAPRDCRFVGVDVSQQELRILAHAVGSPLIEWYRENPNLDLHVKVSELIHQITGIQLGRGIVKTINFAQIYGRGLAATAQQLAVAVEEARMFRNAHRQALPGVKKWERRLAAQAVFTTAGGREYCHDPERPYKSGNTYIQGSASDQSKEVMLAVQPELKRMGGRLGWMAHDEFVARVPRPNASAAEKMMLEAVKDTGSDGARPMFEVPMRGDSYVRTRWQEAA